MYPVVDADFIASIDKLFPLKYSFNKMFIGTAALRCVGLPSASKTMFII